MCSRLSPDGGGGWTEAVLHSFRLNGFDGILPKPVCSRMLPATCLGTTANGGSYNVGTMFEMSRNGNGGWIEKVYSFDYNGTDGAVLKPA